jgi:hypothetical protein
MNKKAAFDFSSEWGEFFFIILLIIGILLGILAPSAVITYLIGFFSGMMAGRLMYDRKYKGRAPYVLIILGFVIGFVIIAAVRGYGLMTLLLFIFGSALSYYLFDRKIIKDIFV